MKKRSMSGPSNEELGNVSLERRGIRSLLNNQDVDEVNTMLVVTQHLNHSFFAWKISTL